MFKTVLTHSVFLIALGLALYVWSDNQSPTALIPAFVGVALSVVAALGVVTGRTKFFFHLLMGLALLMVLGGLGMGVRTAGGEDPAITKLIGMFGMAAICLSLCFAGFRSFKAARAARAAAAER